MDTAHVLLSHEIEARGIAKGEARGEARGEAKGIAKGKAEGEAEVTQVIRLFVAKNPPNLISTELNIPEAKVKDILRKSGLIDQSH